ncbi:MAG: aminotransferase DegT [Candidatus Giovannonibacteria bacterium GW2011_GWB1_46_20]|uniref:Aminotransferase DegT n=2 Tax=Candidatus Giovannoniibacteriota TaxID=1752738 RepID=A0A0G1KVP2_9BACT|nr:MAG: aminotransferase DegT [Parcubacteria group bacterium GW2011_GWC1_44_10]KKT60402.1 MAG: aminotransferase DegT [Candidatus Giovannonibacteria bacterium GW2011_GWA1_44_25]KKU30260.1 MAG: aminotransferase DegT [Candidatus Giovannonibacteria bacterium GW2011_GWB1_46_20]
MASNTTAFGLVIYIQMAKKKIKINLAKPWFDRREPEAAYRVVKSGYLISGPLVEKFEREFAKKIGVKYAIAVNSGSSALLVVQQALGIGRGDEVIVPNMTFISTASSSLYLGARPVFADIEMKTYGIDPEAIVKRIANLPASRRKKLKAIIPVHYAGQSCDLDPILKIARKHKLFVVEDAAEAHLAEYNGRKVGGIGDIGIFSFTPSKPMTTGEGGMITTNNAELAKKCKLIRNFYDINKFQWHEFGFHFRMPETMGAIGLVQLAKLERAVAMRMSIAHRYTKELNKLGCIVTPYERTRKDINFQLYTIMLIPGALSIDRDKFIDELGLRGVQARLYYPCLHKQNVFKGMGRYNDNEFPNSIAFEKNALSLPIYPGLKNKEVNYVISSIQEIVKKYKT